MCVIVFMYVCVRVLLIVCVCVFWCCGGVVLLVLCGGQVVLLG